MTWSDWEDMRDGIADMYKDEFGRAMTRLVDDFERIVGIPDETIARDFERVCDAFDDELAYAITQVRNEYE